MHITEQCYCMFKLTYKFNFQHAQVSPENPSLMAWSCCISDLCLSYRHSTVIISQGEEPFWPGSCSKCRYQLQSNCTSANN